ncbi:amidase domain-containing protein [Halobacillus salinarum]|uniref:Amidase domain-containing protein n=1 Tax=Halobacillus salinarum TaxID=2932257 RepID=A0ABY4EGN0_9BACI|nr:amidase domain-containing protein [Halobacillus salinarum]UOQ43626.1 amidase domain-containing protein [Halobacillus salinarum]
METTTRKLQLYWEKIIDQLETQSEEKWLTKKIEGFKERGQMLERSTFHIKPYHRFRYDQTSELQYMLTLSLLIKDQRHYFLEEGIYHGKAVFEKDKLASQMIKTEEPSTEMNVKETSFVDKETSQRVRFKYNRREAVRYAERWWDSYNPSYHHFEVDCTNYISQCLRAGGAPMWGMSNRSKGWWYSGSSWSYSWAVANALRWYLSGSRQGLTATEVSSPEQLSLGDVICYDFQGNGRFDHNTIVVHKDTQGMPLVNAHTTNSRHRYWSYLDSTAYTPDIQYKFFHIDG